MARLSAVALPPNLQRMITELDDAAAACQAASFSALELLRQAELALSATGSRAKLAAYLRPTTAQFFQSDDTAKAYRKHVRLAPVLRAIEKTWERNRAQLITDFDEDAISSLAFLEDLKGLSTVLTFDQAHPRLSAAAAHRRSGLVKLRGVPRDPWCRRDIKVVAQELAVESLQVIEDKWAMTKDEVASAFGRRQSDNVPFLHQLRKIATITDYDTARKSMADAKQTRLDSYPHTKEEIWTVADIEASIIALQGHQDSPNPFFVHQSGENSADRIDSEKLNQTSASQQSGIDAILSGADILLEASKFVKTHALPTPSSQESEPSLRHQREQSGNAIQKNHKRRHNLDDPNQVRDDEDSTPKRTKFLREDTPEIGRHAVTSKIGDFQDDLSNFHFSLHFDSPVQNSDNISDDGSVDLGSPVQYSDDDSDDGILGFGANDGFDDAADEEGEQQMHNIPESQEPKAKEQDTEPRTRDMTLRSELKVVENKGNSQPGAKSKSLTIQQFTAHENLDSPEGNQPIEDIRHRLEAEGSDQPVETQTLGSHQAQQQALDDKQGTQTQAAGFGLRKGQDISGLKDGEANRPGRTSIEMESSLTKSNSQIDLSMLPDNEDDSDGALEDSIASLSFAKATFLPEAWISSSAFDFVFQHFKCKECLLLSTEINTDTISAPTPLKPNLTTQTRIILPLHHKSPVRHWSLALLNFKTREIVHYDSYVGLILLRRVESVLRKFAEEAVQGSKWSFTSRKCARQPNGWDCGIYTLVNAICLCVNGRVPDAICGDFWRALFQDMLSRDVSSKKQKPFSNLSQKRVSERSELGDYWYTILQHTPLFVDDFENKLARLIEHIEQAKSEVENLRLAHQIFSNLTSTLLQDYAICLDACNTAKTHLNELQASKTTVESLPTLIRPACIDVHTTNTNEQLKLYQKAEKARDKLSCNILFIGSLQGSTSASLERLSSVKERWLEKVNKIEQEFVQLTAEQIAVRKRREALLRRVI